MANDDFGFSKEEARWVIRILVLLVVIMSLIAGYYYSLDTRRSDGLEGRKLDKVQLVGDWAVKPLQYEI